ncbi:Asx homology domain-containing protein [Coprinopsis sp. MPI-PUGE-AT-0042]|nr:Asx homology domain-containing protein [Coprinopsis sp. MPI-PUGE-AT-0042]
MSTQPRRSTRQTAKVGSSTSFGVRKRPRRVVPGADPADILKSLIESPKSVLTRVDVTDVFNMGAWEMLSDESRNELSKLLPPTAFLGYKGSLACPYPQSADAMDVEQDLGSSDTVDPSAVFNNPHLLSAADTWQDQLRSGWLSPEHQEKVEGFLASVRAGNLTAPWKDEVWLSDDTQAQYNPEFSSGTGAPGTLTSFLAGGAALIKFTALVENGILQVGDILAYRRNFSTLGITVEKDAIISAIHPKTHALTVLTTAGVAQDLPVDLLALEPGSPTTPYSQGIRELSNITSPTLLETGLLDANGRLDKSQCPNGNAWKSISVWRRRAGAELSATTKRGGKENHGTLFYLRSVYYSEQ